MDDLKVSEFQRRKYGFFFWVKERFYERSLGHLLREGKLPASVLDNEVLLKDGNALTRLLPYESYEGSCFLNQDTIGMIFQVDRRIDAKDLDVLMHLLAEAGLVVQLTSVLAETASHLLLSVSAAYAQMDELKQAASRLIEPYLAWLDVIDPERFIRIIRPFFQDAEEVASDGYDSRLLINNQFGDVEGSINFDCMTLGGRDIRFYIVSRWAYGGWHLINQIPGVMPAGFVVVITHALCHDAETKAFSTSTTLVSSVPSNKGVGVEPAISKLNESLRKVPFELEKLFASKSWILEREITHQPLILMNTLPMASNLAAQKLLLKRRYVKATNDHLETALFLRCV